MNCKFVTDQMVWSYSNASTFETCPYAWKLIYLDAKKRSQNIFSQIGLVVHELLEEYWNDEIDLWTLPLEFEKRYEKQVTEHAPSYLQKHNYSQKTFDELMSFFTELDWDRNAYDVLGNEMTVKSEHNGLKLTIRPDLIIREKETGLVYLCDFKTSKPFTPKGTPQKKKIAPYWKQLSIYAYFIEKETDVKIDKLRIWFPKLGPSKLVEKDFDRHEMLLALVWWEANIRKAIKSKEFIANTDSKFFCSNLCGVRNHCVNKE